MKLYIAGKITGLDFYEAFSLFEKAEEQLHAIGHQTLNPTKLVDQSTPRKYEEALIDALRVMLCGEAEGVYMLNNWRDSRGARIEHAIAEILGRPIFYQPEAAHA